MSYPSVESALATAFCITSSDIAEGFDLCHGDVIQAIEAILEHAPAAFTAQNIAHSLYSTPKSDGREGRNMGYHLTYLGFAVTAMGLTGAKAMRLKLTHAEIFAGMLAKFLRQKQMAAAPQESLPIACCH